MRRETTILGGTAALAAFVWAAAACTGSVSAPASPRKPDTCPGCLCEPGASSCRLDNDSEGACEYGFCTPGGRTLAQPEVLLR